jgi:hypothetical protein
MSLVDELDSKVLSHKYSPTRGKGKAMFLAQLDEIRAAFKKGYSRSIIWKHLNESGKMPVTYASFATYVYQYITVKEEQALAKLAVRLEKPSSANANIPEATIVKQSSIATNHPFNAEDTRKNKKFYSNDKPEKESLV